MDFALIRDIAEIATVLAFGWVIWEAAKLVSFFMRNNEKVARLLTWEFATDLALAVVTVFMGLFLFIEWKAGTNALILIRPFVGVLNAIALRRLYNHYKRLR